MATTSIMIVTPIWRPRLSEIEAGFLRVTDRTNPATPRAFLAPRGMDVSWYAQRFPAWDVRPIDHRHLSSVEAYSAWMASPRPYQLFADANAIVVCQTDAVLIRPMTEFVVGPYDFLGAPWWPPVRVLRIGKRISVHSQTGGGPLHTSVFGRRLSVGNGGLSIRRTSAFAEIAERLADRYPQHVSSRIHEDVYFAALGPREGLVIADEATAETVFCESGAQALKTPANLWGFHGLERWNPDLARRIIES